MSHLELRFLSHAAAPEGSELYDFVFEVKPYRGVVYGRDGTVKFVMPVNNYSQREASEIIELATAKAVELLQPWMQRVNYDSDHHSRMASFIPPAPVEPHTVDDTLRQRGNVHGDYAVQSAIHDALMKVIEPYTAKLSPQHRQALCMINMKQSRILAGDANYPDHWHDVQGYGKLGEDNCVVTDPNQIELDV